MTATGEARWIGRSLERREDLRLLTGQGEYLGRSPRPRLPPSMLRPLQSRARQDQGDPTGGGACDAGRGRRDHRRRTLEGDSGSEDPGADPRLRCKLSAILAARGGRSVLARRAARRDPGARQVCRRGRRGRRRGRLRAAPRRHRRRGCAARRRTARLRRLGQQRDFWLQLHRWLGSGRDRRERRRGRGVVRRGRRGAQATLPHPPLRCLPHRNPRRARDLERVGRA